MRRSTEGSQSVGNPEGSGYAGPKSDQGLGGGRRSLRTELEAPGGGCLQNRFQHWTLEPACWTVGPRGPTSWHVGEVGVERGLGSGQFRVLLQSGARPG